MELPLVLNYLDYRSFLGDWYRSCKSNTVKYSYRQFASDLGFNPSNFLHLVVTGKRNCSEEAVRKIVKHIKGSAQEKKYFELLVSYNQSENAHSKDEQLKKLEELRGKKRRLIDSDEAKFFVNWYIPVLREIICLKNFVPNLSWISKKLNPSVSQEKVLEGLKILERLGYIKKEGNKYKQIESHLTTSPEVNSDWILHYHREMMNLALESLQLPSSARDVSSMTIGVTSEQFQRIKKKIVAFRDEIQHELEEDGSVLPESVVQLNIQFFPLTKNSK
ncbi:TIGR02147 family protein [bacterium]|nr:TIGR02147 family protein [bacterium]